MEENNDKDIKTPDGVINKNGKEFKAIKSKKEKSSKTGFGKTVVIPFLSGVLGAGIVLGTCFGVTGIRNTILQTENKNSVSASTSNTTQLNTSQISLEEYSETGIGVAQKILPSIVGIKVEFPVNSIFLNQTSIASAEGSGIIISTDGYILTNNHVVSSASNSSFYSLGEATKIIVNLYN